MMEEIDAGEVSQTKKTRILKFESNDARLKYRIDDEDDTLALKETSSLSEQKVFERDEQEPMPIPVIN